MYDQLCSLKKPEHVVKAEQSLEPGWDFQKGWGQSQQKLKGPWRQDAPEVQLGQFSSSKLWWVDVFSRHDSFAAPDYILNLKNKIYNVVA